MSYRIEDCEWCGRDFRFSGEGFVCDECLALPDVTFCNDCNAQPDEVDIWEAANRRPYPEARTTFLERCDECAPVAVAS